jgi:hypothetical protein
MFYCLDYFHAMKKPPVYKNGRIEKALPICALNWTAWGNRALSIRMDDEKQIATMAMKSLTCESLDKGER